MSTPATATGALHRYTLDGAIFNRSWALNHSPLERQYNRAKVKPISSPLCSALLVDWLDTDSTKQWRLSTHERLEQLDSEIFEISCTEAKYLHVLIKGLVGIHSEIFTQCMVREKQLGRLEHLAGYKGW